ncbi:hypothetical protein EMIT048CA2_420002 [Pseudomonas chlororaphis]
MWSPRGAMQTLRATRGRGARLGGTANVSELLINTVNRMEPKLLTGFDQKVRDWLSFLHLGTR